MKRRAGGRVQGGRRQRDGGLGMGDRVEGKVGGQARKRRRNKESKRHAVSDDTVPHFTQPLREAKGFLGVSESQNRGSCKHRPSCPGKSLRNHPSPNGGIRRQSGEEVAGARPAAEGGWIKPRVHCPWG